MTTVMTGKEPTPKRKKNSGLSVIKLGLIAGGVGILLVIVGVIAFASDQAARRSPFNVAPFPGAEEWGTADETNYSRSVFYRVADSSPEDVVAYYQEKLNQHTGDRAEECVRVPQTGSMPLDPNNPRAIPFEYRCLFDNSGWQTSQYTQVRIYPGYGENTGKTIIEYQQRWTP
ncbi:MAG: hypothetical protein IAE89_04075 [Anaerolineae bacterium]|nr:hypothetical protein [Anaerolineae bacterium]